MLLKSLSFLLSLSIFVSCEIPTDENIADSVAPPSNQVPGPSAPDQDNPPDPDPAPTPVPTPTSPDLIPIGDSLSARLSDNVWVMIYDPSEDHRIIYYDFKVADSIPNSNILPNCSIPETADLAQVYIDFKRSGLMLRMDIGIEDEMDCLKKFTISTWQLNIEDEKIKVVNFDDPTSPYILMVKEKENHLLLKPDPSGNHFLGD